MSQKKLNTFLTTLIVNGFHINSVNRISIDNALINVFQYDKLGAKVNYTFLLSIEGSNPNLIQSLKIDSKELNSTPIVISDKLETDECICYRVDRFADLIGGFVNTGLILIPNLPDILDLLGFNHLPEGLEGKPDDLLEIYVKECLQYLLSSPARRFGNDRLFESLPDGVVIGKDQTIIQYDSKAYSNGFSFSSDDIERFAKYVNEFNTRYSSHIGTVYEFLIVSGRFNDSENSIKDRSDSLYEKCQTKLTCVTSRELGEFVSLIRQCSSFRNLINWKRIFSNLVLTRKLLESEIDKIKKDNLA